MFKKENMKYVKLGITGVVTTIVCILFFFFVYRIANFHRFVKMIVSILMPFVYGGALAYMITPLCGKLEKLLSRVTKKKNLVKAGAIVLSLLIAIVLVLSIIVLVVPQTIVSIVKLSNTLPDELQTVSANINNLLANHPAMQKNWIYFWKEFNAFLDKWIDTNILSQSQAILTKVLERISVVVGVLKNSFLGVIIAAYMLSNRKQFGAQSKLLVYSVFSEKWADFLMEEARFTNKVFHGFFMGKLIDSTIIGIICFIGCKVMGYEAAVLVALIVGITNMIPFFGPYFGAIPSAIILLLESPMHCVTFIIFIIILQQVDGNIIGPKILGDSTGLSGFWVLFAILLFGGLWGLIGMIIGIPVFAVIYDLIRRLTYNGLRRRDQETMITAYEQEYHA